MLEAVAESDRIQVHERINRLEAQFQQGILERFEDLAPDVAAILDKRKSEEMP
jgi:hypothetical protein